MSKYVLWILVLLACGVLAACQLAGAIPASSPTATPVLGTSTHTVLPIAPSATATRTASPTATLRPTQTQRPSATPSQTPSPQPTSTAYPSFDASRIITVTPAPTAVCPVETPGLQITLDVDPNISSYGWDQAIQLAFDQGASIRQVARDFDRIFGVTGMLPILDMTGDGIQELEVTHEYGATYWGCSLGQYKILLEYSVAENGGWLPSIYRIVDLNGNGIPDVLIYYQATIGWDNTLDVLEWDGRQFNSLIQAIHGREPANLSRLGRGLHWYANDTFWESVPYVDGANDIFVSDIDGNLTKEIIMTDSGPSNLDTYLRGWPWRDKRVVFRWDGLHYLYSELIMDPPEFRFQAVQEADRLFLLGEYDQALALYRQAIFNEELKAWGPELQQCEFDRVINNLECSPSPDPDEFPALAAYARYRIMLHHLVHGWRKDAQTVYDALLQKYPQGLPGYPYAEMARLVWEETAAGGEIETACARAVAYASDHPEILAVLGDYNHGYQSHEYVAADVCPFP